MKFLRKFANPALDNSLATKTRQKNFEIFSSLISKVPKPIKILDIGGTQYYWEKVNFLENDDTKKLSQYSINPLFSNSWIIKLFSVK